MTTTTRTAAASSANCPGVVSPSSATRADSALPIHHLATNNREDRLTLHAPAVKGVVAGLARRLFPVAGPLAVEIDDGEDVLVKRKGRAPDFALQVAANTVKGLRLNPDKE